MPPMNNRGATFGTGVTGRAVDAIALARDAHRLARPRLPDDRDALLHQARALRQLAAEVVELELPITETHAEIEAPAGQNRQRRGVLREPHRIRQRQQHQIGADAHAPRALADRGGDHQRRRCVAVSAEVMLRQPHRIEAERFGPADLFERRAIQRLERHRARRRIAEVVPESEVDVATAHRRFAVNAADEAQQRVVIRSGVFDERRMAAVRHFEQLRIRQLASSEPSDVRRHNAIVGADDDQRRRFDPRHQRALIDVRERSERRIGGRSRLQRRSASTSV